MRCLLADPYIQGGPCGPVVVVSSGWIHRFQWLLRAAVRTWVLQPRSTTKLQGRHQRLVESISPAGPGFLRS